MQCSREDKQNQREISKYDFGVGCVLVDLFIQEHTIFIPIEFTCFVRLMCRPCALVFCLEATLQTQLAGAFAYR